MRSARCNHLALLVLGAVLLCPARAPARDSPEFWVDALGCEVPIDVRYHVLPRKDGVRFEIPDTSGTRIWIGPLEQHAAKPLDSRYRGALKVERYAPGCMSISALPWVAVQGLHQEVDLIGVSDQEAMHIIEHCNATMNPEAIAIAARMAKGCAAILPTSEAKEALFGRAGLTQVVNPRQGTTRPFPVTSWEVFLPERSPNLKAQDVHKGALVTAVCGVPVSEIEEGGDSLCCGTPITTHIDAVIVEDGRSRAITGPAPIHAPASANAVPARASAAASGCGS
jgi:hypothetical protein